MKTFGQNLKELRINCGYNQKQFAVLLNTTQQRVSEWETNKVEPSLYNILKILEVLHVDFEELVDGLVK